MTVTNAWAGALTTTGFQVSAKVSASASLVVSTSSALTSPTTFGPLTPGTFGEVLFTATGLTPGTTYFWGVDSGGVDATWKGSVKLPSTGAHSFTFWAGSCQQSNSTSAVFNRIVNLAPDFGIHMGDLHYDNNNTTSESLWHASLDNVLTTPAGALLRTIPTEYVWDDHDYCGNNTESNAAGRSAAVAYYPKRVPHHPFGGSTGAVYRTFVRGRVRFMLLDERADRSTSSGTVLGATQKAWLKSTLLTATEPLIVLMVGSAWLATVDSDNWASSTNIGERNEINQWLFDNGFKNRVLFLGGDMHALGYDDGSHNTAGGLNAPVVLSASLDQTGSNKGGTWTYGPNPGNDRFSLLSVTDTGGATLTVGLQQYAVGALVNSATMTFGATAPGGGVVSSSTAARATVTDHIRVNGVDRLIVGARLNGVDRTVAGVDAT